MLQDIAVLTGATYVSEEIGRKLDSVTIEDLGRADRVISDKDSTTLVGGKGDKKALEDRINLIKGEMENTTSDYDKEKLQERVAKLTGGVAVISVGAATEGEMKEKKLRVDDAVNATKAAVEEGIVPGGGVAFLRAKEAVESMNLEGDEATGAKILIDALEKPTRTIVENAGLDAGRILGELYRQTTEKNNKNFGYNVISMQYVDMIQDGITDPTKVAKSALQNAVSVATLIMTTECLVTEAPKKDDPMPAGGGMGGMGGMEGMM